MDLTLGFSPCPNDTFIFDALINHKIDTKGYTFEVSYDDVETLNQKAFQKQLDITKLSYHAFAYVAQDYALLDAGSALGFGVGPLLITADLKYVDELQANPTAIYDYKVGIPGKFTTANFLLGLAYPGLQNKEVMVFSNIEKALLEGQIDLGLIIHENRFTYQQKGLLKVRDLGDFWEQKTHSPIPLGGIVIKRELEDKVKQDINELIRLSVEYAFAHPKSGMDYIRSHSQEMDDAVLQKHIDLYVNAYSIDLGEKGRKAIQDMMSWAADLKLIPEPKQQLFLNESKKNFSKL